MAGSSPSAAPRLGLSHFAFGAHPATSPSPSPSPASLPLPGLNPSPNNVMAPPASPLRLGAGFILPATAELSTPSPPPPAAMDTATAPPEHAEAAAALPPLPVLPGPIPFAAPSGWGGALQARAPAGASDSEAPLAAAPGEADVIVVEAMDAEDEGEAPGPSIHHHPESAAAARAAAPHLQAAAAQGVPATPSQGSTTARAAAEAAATATAISPAMTTGTPTTTTTTTTAAAATAVKHSSPSSLDDFRSPKRRREDKADDDRSDYQTCSICFEPWANAGRHRIASLKCGHLFGKSCIEKWLKGQGGRCPQCNAKAKKGDIRLIYGKAIETVDTTEKEAVMRELEKERGERKRAQQSEARYILKYQLLKAELERVQCRLREAAASPAAGGRAGAAASASSAASQPARDSHGHQTFELRQTVDLLHANNRILTQDPTSGLLIASAEQTVANMFYPAGHGILKMSALDKRHTQYIGLHSKQIKDLCCSPDGQGLLLSASLDKTVKVTSMESNSVAQTYKVGAPAWSCAWNAADCTYFYVGLTKSTVLVYDVRNTDTWVERVEGSSTPPIVSLDYVREQDSFESSGLLAGTLSGVNFWRQLEDSQDFIEHTLNPLQGPCTWTTVCPQTRKIVASFRPNTAVPRTRHLMCDLQMETHNSAHVVDCAITKQFLGGPSSKLLSRPQLFTPPDRTTPFLAAGDETSKSVMVWDTENPDSVLQRLPSGGSPCLDLQFVQGQDEASFHLAALVDRKILLYQWRAG